MLDGQYRPIQNAFGLKALKLNPTMPAKNLAIAGDDEMSNIPLTIFKEQHEPFVVPVMPSIQDLPYEKTAEKGANDTLSMEDFTTDNFTLGSPVEYI